MYHTNLRLRRAGAGFLAKTRMPPAGILKTKEEGRCARLLADFFDADRDRVALDHRFVHRLQCAIKG